jgi:hypothetical protein
VNEAAARRITLVQAFDAAESPLWTREDSVWASRLAAETSPAGATPERLAIERANHALQRLEPRDPAVRRWLARSGWRWSWLSFALGAGFAAGLAADLIGRGRYIDLLAPALWLIVAWNLAIYALLMLGALRHGRAANGWFRRLLATWWERGVGRGPLREAAGRWAAVSAPLTATRAAVVVHAAAAALGIGMMAGLYLRGLVFDFRAAWESTFLDAPTVHALLSTALAPASAISGVALPDVAAVEAMRLTPQAPHPAAPAAAWIHLYAATLLLFVVGPRVLLAVSAFLRAAARALRMHVPLDAAGMARFARWHRSGAALVQVLPYAQTPAAQTALGLRELLAAELGDDLVLKMGDVTTIGDEDAVAARAGHAGAALRVALVDLGATPEDEHHGRFARAVAAAEPPAMALLLADEAAFRTRFGSLPGRVDERRAAWRDFAQRHGLRLLCVNLDRPEQGEAITALQQALRE